jgi:hypothetical protein
MSRRFQARDERGAALLMAVGVMIMLGLLGAGLVGALTTSLDHRALLDAARNREYAADGAIEYAITQVRQLTAPGPGQKACGPYTHSLNGVSIHVDCINSPRVTRTGLLQRDVIFVACENIGATCDDSSSNTQLHTIIRAEVNFESASQSGTPVTATYLQTWSVNR